MSEGFVKLPREITNWRWFADANILRVYIYLLVNAAFKETEWKKEKIKKGQLITGRTKIAKELGISESKVRTALKNLESTGDISIKTTNRYSLITLLNWEKTQKINYFFKGKSPTNRQQITNKSPQYNNVNNEKNVKKYGARPRWRENAGVIDSIDWSRMDEIINAD